MSQILTCDLQLRDAVGRTSISIEDSFLVFYVVNGRTDGGDCSTSRAEAVGRNEAEDHGGGGYLLRNCRTTASTWCSCVVLLNSR